MYNNTPKNNSIMKKSLLSILFGITLLLQLPACSSVLSSVTDSLANSLSNGVLNQNDPETVRLGAPAYLLLIDGIITDHPNNADILLAGSKLYASYTGAFVNDPARSRRMAQKAYDYALRATCLEIEELCNADKQTFDIFQKNLQKHSTDDEVAFLYALGGAWAGWIQTNSGDWNAIADIPKITTIMQQVITLADGFDNGGAHAYLGVLETLRPASLGGKPEEGRAHFEKAIELSHNKNLMFKVLFARHYARPLYNRNLHDALLKEVLQEPAEAPQLTLINTLAKQEAVKLLKSADEYF